MRLRNKPWTEKFLEINKDKLINWTEENKISSQAFFNNNKPIHLEIGCGKGNFISTLAINNSNINFIGMEKERTVVGVALKKAINIFQEANLTMTNLKFLNKFAEKLTDMFEPKSIDQIYLNFSDPWPKSKHAKKRLTNVTFLDLYKVILKPGGEIHMKTDNDGLFISTLEQLELRPEWIIMQKTTDLYDNPEMLEGNIPTEYETRFNNMGKNINKVIFKQNS
ncbi:tRNA (guanine-N(7)-)-methyltransferase [Williamsoniiplasma somnilux]|uniref:tRNA (guanine-N(7)-)-methyltransferase n=1 Tax=Williamsoniiplasma somnilux TaxID=215578 RepID=A0A2K8NYX0_9MOLU|nr:tRNA (guanosine(46)-N7)-methyltransferase TrmB [Williamsoniiplasma somnilux]ATZ19015.1 tRNA (guanine-N(7)-)-methyltransferase [Williamsoniiplasma somnilux]